MINLIHSFENEQTGMFIDLADERGALAINCKTGDVQIEQRDSKAVCRSVVLGRECRRFAMYPVLRGPLRGKAWEVRLHFGINDVVKIGVTTDQQGALTWINQANDCIDHVKRSTFTNAGKTAADGVSVSVREKPRSIVGAKRLHRKKLILVH